MNNMYLYTTVMAIASDQMFEAYDCLQDLITEIPDGEVQTYQWGAKYKGWYFIKTFGPYQLFVYIMMSPRKSLREYVLLVDTRPRIIADKILVVGKRYPDEATIVDLDGIRYAIQKERKDPECVCQSIMKACLSRIAKATPDNLAKIIRSDDENIPKSIGAYGGGLPSLGKRT